MISLSSSVHLALAGVALYLAVHHLVLWATRRAAALHLWVAGWSLLSVVVLVARLVQRTARDSVAGSAAVNVVIAASLLLIPLFFGLGDAIGGKRTSPRLVLAVFAVATLLIGAHSFSGAIARGKPFLKRDAWGNTLWAFPEPGPLGLPLGLLVVASALYAFATITTSSELRVRDRRAFAVGFGVYSAAGVHDALHAWGVVKSVPIFEFAFVGIAIALDYWLARRFSRLNERLEEAVHERTRELSTKSAELERANASLDHALVEAQAASRVKGEFLANMSHELRTPMNGILGVADLLLRTPLSAEQREYVEITRRSGDALLAVIHDVLEFSRGESGAIELEVAPFEPGEVVEDVVEMLGVQAEAKGLDVAAIVDESALARVDGDANRVRQVLINLVGNAVKFTSAGEIVVRVARLVGDDARDASLRFSVSDTGIGVPREARERIFAPFTQADGSMTRRFGGTGLGLAISAQLVRRMGGAIGVESEVGAGSTFWFTLPARSSSGQGPPRPAIVAPTKIDEARALVVERSASVRASLAGPLAVAGFDVVGADALDDRARGAAVVVLGACGATADEVAAWHARVGAPPVVALRSPDERGLRADVSRGISVAARLGKPVRRRALLAAVERALGDRSAPPPPAAGLVTTGRERRAPRVLVAESSPMNARVLEAQLSHLGCQVVVASGAAAAIAAATREGDEGFDAALLDADLPGLDLGDALARLRAAMATSSWLPVVALTGHATADERAALLARGVDDCLTKPVSLDALRATIRRYCPPPSVVSP